MKEFVLNRLHYVSLPYCIFDCWLMLSGVTLDTLQDKQMLDDFVEAMRGDISCTMIDRYINNGNGKANGNSNSYVNSNGNDNDNGKTIWYIDANNLYGYPMMQKLPYKDFKYSDTSIDVILNIPEDSDHGYYIVYDIKYFNSCKERTEQLALMPNKKKINDNELGYRERYKVRARTEKLNLNQNNISEYMDLYRMLKF